VAGLGCLSERLRADAYASIENAAALYRSIGVTGDTTELVTGQIATVGGHRALPGPRPVGDGCHLAGCLHHRSGDLLFRRRKIEWR
jgi:hypothetical protein